MAAEPPTATSMRPVPCQLEWRWDSDANQTRAGVVAAVWAAPTGAVARLNVHGYAIQSALRQIECSLTGSTPQPQWTAASDVTTIPESDGDRISLLERFKHKWPVGAGGIEPESNSLVGVRFVCQFSGEALVDAGSAERLLSVRGGRFTGHPHWRVDSIRIHCAGYPINCHDAITKGAPRNAAAAAAAAAGTAGTAYTAAILRSPAAAAAMVSASACHGESATHAAATATVGGHADGEETALVDGAADVGAAKPLVDVTVCVQYIYGTGYSVHTLLEFVAWYVLLGARRIVLFDSMEPHYEHDEALRRLAYERQQALHGLAKALRGRVVVVSGLALWDMMRRTRSHMSGQSVAGSLCRAAAAALGERAERVAYVAMPDLDEFLSPPATDASRADGLATSLRGALSRLAGHVWQGRPATGLYLDDPAAVRSRVHPGGGRRRCLSFASVYYVMPPCADAAAATLGGEGRGASTAPMGAPALGAAAQPAVLRRSWRSQPDNFEEGPSHRWRIFRHWNFFVRSKYLVDASDPAIVTANHECCCKPALSTAMQCQNRSGLLGNHSCATLEFMPLEHWHVRHLRGAGRSSDERVDGCRRKPLLDAVLARNGTRRHVQIEAQRETFPPSWAAEYTDALTKLKQRVAAVATGGRL